LPIKASQVQRERKTQKNTIDYFNDPSGIEKTNNINQKNGNGGKSIPVKNFLN